MAKKPSGWNIYIVRCADNTLYTGIAKDVAKRVDEHNSNTHLGAKYTRGRRPIRLVYQEAAKNRSEATSRESEIKKMSRGRKDVLIVKYNFVKKNTEKK